MKFNVLKEVSVKDHAQSGKTKHFADGELLPAASKLQIAQFDDDNGFYLYYLDDNDEEMTDTYHDTIEEALRQAEFEYNVKPGEWLSLND